MRLEPSDKPMYHRMDQRDRALIMIPVFGIAASLGLFFLAARFPAIIGGPFIGLGVCGMFGSAIRYWKLKQLIMPLSGCCLEIQTSCFVARQPWKKEHYEQCRIYFKDKCRCHTGHPGSGSFYGDSSGGRRCFKTHNTVRDRPGSLLFIPLSGYFPEEI